MRAWQVLLITLVGVALAASFLTPKRPLLIWNASPSVPVRLYRVEAGPIDRGDLVLVRPPAEVAELAHRRRYLSKSAYLIKVVAAIAGDRVCRFADRGVRPGRIGHPCARPRQARTIDAVLAGLPPARRRRTLPARAEHSHFDSHYFGIVPAGHLIGRAVPLWLTPAAN